MSSDNTDDVDDGWSTVPPKKASKKASSLKGSLPSTFNNGGSIDLSPAAFSTRAVEDKPFHGYNRIFDKIRGKYTFVEYKMLNAGRSTDFRRLVEIRDSSGDYILGYIQLDTHNSGSGPSEMNHMWWDGTKWNVFDGTDHWI